METHLDDLCRHLEISGREAQVIIYQLLTVRRRGPKFEQRGSVSIWRLSWFGRNWFLKLEPFPPPVFLYLFPGLFFYSFFYLLRHRGEVNVIHAHGLVAADIVAILGKFFRKKMVLVLTPSIIWRNALYLVA